MTKCTPKRLEIHAAALYRSFVPSCIAKLTIVRMPAKNSCANPPCTFCASVDFFAIFEINVNVNASANNGTNADPRKIPVSNGEFTNK